MYLELRLIGTGKLKKKKQTSMLSQERSRVKPFFPTSTNVRLLTTWFRFNKPWHQKAPAHGFYCTEVQQLSHADEP